MICEICQGEGWVCENHPEIKWNNGNGHLKQFKFYEQCFGAGMPCKCNTAQPPWNYENAEEE